MGILNSKERIMDTILTTEGRKQIAKSSLRATYYSFTDMGADYNLSTIVSGALSAGNLPFNETYRIALEASNLPQDVIVYETDDSGKINAVRPNVDTGNDTPISVHSGKVFLLLTGSNVEEVLDNDTFASLADGIVNSSMTSFVDQMILSSPDPMDDTSKTFQISNSDSTFEIKNENIMMLSDNMPEADVDIIESLFFDEKLSNVPNYKFLPPINKKENADDNQTIGKYANLNQSSILSYETISSSLNNLKEHGFSDEITFVQTSKENNLVCQLFEYGNNKLGRLDVIDFGQVQTVNSSAETELKHIFFCGKIYLDKNNTATYVNMFTIVFDIEGSR